MQVAGNEQVGLSFSAPVMSVPISSPPLLNATDLQQHPERADNVCLRAQSRQALVDGRNEAHKVDETRT